MSVPVREGLLVLISKQRTPVELLEGAKYCSEPRLLAIKVQRPTTGQTGDSLGAVLRVL